MRYSLGTRSVSGCLFLLGVIALSYLAGAMVIFFGLPSADFLERALIGSRAWLVRRSSPPPTSEPWAATTTNLAGGGSDDPEKTFDGFTLYACADHEGEGAEAILIDMHGDLVHRWSVPHWQLRLYQPAYAAQSHAVHNFKPCFYGLRLDASGDLLVVAHGAAPITGYGLLKLDKDSQVLWEYPAPVHHDIDVGEDGTIYAIQTELLDEMPPGMEHIATPCQSDQVVLLSSDGKPLQEPISLLDAIRGSPYAVLLSPLGAKRDTRTPELLHTNFVEVLRHEQAPRFPGFKAGQVLVSLRHLDAIAVLDVKTRSIAWAASGPWRAQHDPHFLDNGHLLIFDNRGGQGGSRVLEYDPQTQAFPWSYPGADCRTFYSSERGMSQRLPNGNTLIVNSEGAEIMEISPGQEVVWSFSHPAGYFITTGRRYSANELPFLGDRSPRP